MTMTKKQKLSKGPELRAYLKDLERNTWGDNKEPCFDCSCLEMLGNKFLVEKFCYSAARIAHTGWKITLDVYLDPEFKLGRMRVSRQISDDDMRRPDWQAVVYREAHGILLDALNKVEDDWL